MKLDRLLLFLIYFIFCLSFSLLQFHVVLPSTNNRRGFACQLDFENKKPKKTFIYNTISSILKLHLGRAFIMNNSNVSMSKVAGSKEKETEALTQLDCHFFGDKFEYHMLIFCMDHKFLCLSSHVSVRAKTQDEDADDKQKQQPRKANPRSCAKRVSYFLSFLL